MVLHIAASRHQIKIQRLCTTERIRHSVSDSINHALAFYDMPFHTQNSQNHNAPHILNTSNHKKLHIYEN